MLRIRIRGVERWRFMLLLVEGCLLGICGRDTEFKIDVLPFGCSRFLYSIYLMPEYHHILDEGLVTIRSS
jgi:hypothetical protein